MTESKKPSLGLIPKLILAIVLGIIVGGVLPEYLGSFPLREVVTRIAVTFSRTLVSY